MTYQRKNDENESRQHGQIPSSDTSSFALFAFSDLCSIAHHFFLGRGEREGVRDSKSEDVGHNLVTCQVSNFLEPTAKSHPFTIETTYPHPLAPRFKSYDLNFLGEPKLVSPFPTKPYMIHAPLQEQHRK